MLTSEHEETGITLWSMRHSPGGATFTCCLDCKRSEKTTICERRGFQCTDRGNEREQNPFRCDLGNKLLHVKESERRDPGFEALTEIGFLDWAFRSLPVSRPLILIFFSNLSVSTPKKVVLMNPEML
jgi:hypothetical protein